MRLFMNGIKELDAKYTEEHIEIPKDYFSTSHLFVMHRGSISDIQLYSNALEDEDLKKWTTCELDKPGDVFNWDVKMINMSSHNEKMIISANKVSTENFCVAKKGEQSQFHIFGQGSDITQIEGNIICKRLNAKYARLPTDEDGLKSMAIVGKQFLKKTNVSSFSAWIGGNSRIHETNRRAHWYPEPSGIYDFEDPVTGKILTNDLNRKYIVRQYATYESPETMCLMVVADLDKDIRFEWQACSRKFAGRMVCEFEKMPFFRIKGLCAKSPIDRMFQLIDPRPGQGSEYVLKKKKTIQIFIIEDERRRYSGSTGWIAAYIDEENQWRMTNHVNLNISIILPDTDKLPVGKKVWTIPESSCNKG